MRSRSLFGLIALLCAPAAPAEIMGPANVSPTYIDFGEVRVGQPVTVAVTVRNLTASTMTVGGGGLLSEDEAEGFSGAGSCGSPVPAMGSCQLNYTYRPKNNSGVLVTALTSISVSAGGQGRGIPIALAGRGYGQMLDVSPQTIGFGDWLIGQTVTVPVTIHNPTPNTVNFGGGGTNTAAFTGDTGTCGNTIDPGETCFWNYRFTPNALGQASDSTSIGASIPNQVGQSYPIVLTGNGIATPGLAAAGPLHFGFGQVQLGSLAEVPFFWTNISGVTVNSGGGGLPIESHFAGFGTGGTNCSGGVAMPGGTCTYVYRFRPRVLGFLEDETGRGFSSATGTQSIDITMNGTGVGHVARIFPTEFDFGNVKIGTQSPNVFVTVVNDGDLAMTGIIGGDVTQPFFRFATSCGATLPAGDTCTITYRYNSNIDSVGEHETQTILAFTNSIGLQSTQVITMRGRGVDLVFAHGFE